MTVASFKKYKNAKYRHRTDAELAGSSWVFDRLIDSDAEQDTTRLNDNDVSFKFKPPQINITIYYRKSYLKNITSIQNFQWRI